MSLELGLIISTTRNSDGGSSLRSIVLWAKKARYSSVAFSSTSE